MMQLEELVLYRADGPPRRLAFRLGALNIVTGDSRTGKSSLINILRFALGSDSPHFPAGPIQQTVIWVGLKARVGPTSFFIGRPVPSAGRTTNAAMLLIGDAPIPEAVKSLEANVTSADVTHYLGGLLGIEENVNVPAETNTRPPLTANFRHALYYCFQGQGEIANPDMLFHHQNRDFQTLAIRDTLPYFLGAQGIDDLRKRDELVRVRRDLRRLSARVEQIDEERESGFNSSYGLLSEAREVALIPGDSNVTTPQEARALLNEALEAPTTLAEPFENLDQEGARLRRERAEVVDRLRAIAEEERALNEFSDVDGAYGVELVEQRARLVSIGLLPQQDAEAVCPLCAQLLDDPARPLGEDVERALRLTEAHLRSALRARPNVETARQRLVNEASELRVRLAVITASLTRVIERDEIATSRSEALNRQAWVQGRISQYLETFPAEEDEAVAAIRRQLVALQMRAAALVDELDVEALRSRTQSLVQIVSRRITDMARSLDLEHSEHGVRLEQYRLTIVADTPDGPAYMDRGEIGSGMNWVGYHLATYLALQAFFIQARRPVPSFVVFDQPSQAFFPADREMGGDVTEMDDDDREHTRQLYRLMFENVSSHDGDLQVIAFDHADFEDAWFRECVIQRWRGGEALIPSDWLP